jgi:competence protein ComGC
MKRLKNKAQFYLVSAMILATIIIALISITNFSNKKENNQIENYGKELEIEIEKVYDYDEITNHDSIEDFTKEYSYYIGKDFDAFFIIADDPEIEAYTFTDDTKVDLSSQAGIVGDEIIFSDGNVSYNFELNEGKNFYFVLSQDIGGERYVYTN